MSADNEKFTLKEILEYGKKGEVAIQCHDNPDADALASGFALRWYLEKKGVDTRFIYGGPSQVQKSNLVKMIEQLEIPVEYTRNLEKPNLLVTVDCQYGESNVTRFEADNVMVIDHHRVSGTLPERSDVRSNYGSCSTVIYELLQDEGVDINEDEHVATALYYGLMTDTDNFSDLSHPADRDLRDVAVYSNMDIMYFKNSNLSKEELRIAGDALQKAFFNEKYSYGVIETKPCDPNILGMISDMLLEVDGVDTCLVYNILSGGVKISVRSCTKETKASELAGYIAEGFGGGGGHMVKAGGFLKKDLIEKAGIKYERDEIEKMMRERMHAYHSESEVYYAGTKDTDISEFAHYTKMEVTVGYLKATDFAPAGTKLTIRTLEGDVDVAVEEDLYIILGIEGEIYPCRQKKFEASYRLSDAPYVYPGEYPPVVIDSMGGERLALLPFAKSCIAKGGSGIYAKQIDHRMKVFTTWDKEKYYLGVPGDYMAVRADDLKDAYIIANRIFPLTYALTKEQN